MPGVGKGRYLLQVWHRRSEKGETTDLNPPVILRHQFEHVVRKYGDIAILFDVNGPVFPDEHLEREAWKVGLVKLLEFHGIKVPAPVLLRGNLEVDAVWEVGDMDQFMPRWFAILAPYLRRIATNPQRFDNLVAPFRNLAMDEKTWAGEVRFAPGALEFFDACRSEGVPFGFVTSNNGPRILDTSRIVLDGGNGGRRTNDLFHVLVSKETITRHEVPGKPWPYAFRIGAERLGVRFERCVIVEDRVQNITRALDPHDRGPSAAGGVLIHNETGETTRQDVRPSPDNRIVNVFDMRDLRVAA